MKSSGHRALSIASFILLAIVVSGCANRVSPKTETVTPSGLLPTPSRLEIAAKVKAASAPWASSPAFSTYAYDKPLPLSAGNDKEVAILAGGCFWCLEAAYELIPGVEDVVSGYIGGTVPRPSYEIVSMDVTGHAEAVRIVFDPSVISYSELLDLFWKIHDPTTLNYQGYDVGSQYRSAIYFVSETQRIAAGKSIKAQQTNWKDPIVTELVPAGDFWIAEKYHQDFYRLNPEYGYCVAVISPKLKKAGLKQ
jgi:peptide-methionine (S)-S-oxide reductase